MPIPLTQLTGDIIPGSTVLFFGAGSSIPSRAPSVDDLRRQIGTAFKLDIGDFSLSEIAGLAETKTKNRKKLIAEVRKLFVGLKPTGGLTNLPLYEWKSIFTTNYDCLIENCFETRNVDLTVLSSNFDFTIHDNPRAARLYKIHGTIEKDVSDGHNSRIIISENDYELTDEYRESLYDRLKADLAGSHLIIIGYSLSDPHIKDIVARASKINAQTMGGGRITLMLYTRDDERALLLEDRGFEVCFGGIDEFFAELARKQPQAKGDIIDRATKILARHPVLTPITTEVEHAADVNAADVSLMFHGRAASFADVAAGLTFQRNFTSLIDKHLSTEGTLSATILGASGVGKTTMARQVALKAKARGLECWEHKGDHPLVVDQWLSVANALEKDGKEGLLLIDEAHAHLSTLSELIDKLVSNDTAHLKLLLVSSRNQWGPRVKTPNLFRFGKEWVVSQLKPDEIERLLQLIEANDRIRPLVEESFEGFSRHERRRRLSERCEKDFFVCLKNIFASENMDDIILREFATVPEPHREVYRHVAAMENAGIRVHRQLVIRLLGISGGSVAAALDQLTDIVQEYSIEEKDGIYGWRCRHLVIAGIIAKFKFYDVEKTVDLFDRVIGCISPTYDIEIRTIRELCNVDTGLPRIPDKETQNRLLRKMISVAPGERVPRHRLIRNLIAMGHFEKADTEIRIFNKDFGSDGPVRRYKIDLMVARASKTPGLLEEDRIVILEQAQEVAVASIDRLPNHKAILKAYAELGIEYYRRTSKYTFFDDAMARFKDAEENAGDPDITKLIQRYERKILGHVVEAVDLELDD